MWAGSGKGNASQTRIIKKLSWAVMWLEENTMEWKAAKLSEHKNTMFHRYLKCGKVEINKTECRNGCRNMCIKINGIKMEYKVNGIKEI